MDHHRRGTSPFVLILVLVIGLPLIGFVSLWLGISVGVRSEPAKEGNVAQSWLATSLSKRWVALTSFELPGLGEGLKVGPEDRVSKASPRKKPSLSSEEVSLEPRTAHVALPADMSRQLEREKEALPESFPAGPFTVQVGSFFEPTEANEMAKLLKSRGFPHAFVSQSPLPGKETPWYRVWLGFYNDFKTAREVGAFLEAKETVARAWVRRADNVPKPARGGK